jgi:hypothetical protein
MSSLSTLRLFVSLIAWLGFSVQAAEVLKFDRSTWQHFLGSAHKPLATVFTTTDCEYCPAVIDRLAHALRERHVKARLNVVIMDSPVRDMALLTDPHFGLADQLYVFDQEQAMQIRHAIDPTWRGVTPYVVLLGKRGPPRSFLGMPPAGEVDAFLLRH